MPKQDNEAILKKKLKAVCDRILTENKWETFKDYEIEVVPDGIPVMAAITLADRVIHVAAPESFYQSIEGFLKQENLNIPLDTGVDQVMDFVLGHEYGHHKIAPVSKEHFEAINNAIYGVIEKKEVREEEIIQKCFHIQNLFTDTIDNTVNSLKGHKNYKEGFDLFYLSAYYLNGRQPGKKFKKHRVDKAMTLFYNSNHFLAQTDPLMNQKMSKYMALVFPAKARYMRKVVDVFTCDSDITSRVIARKTTPEDNEYIVSRMTDTTLWPGMVEEYTKIIYPLIRRVDDTVSNQYTRGQQQQGSGKQGKPQQGNGKQKKGKQEKQQQGKGGADKKKEEKKDGGGGEEEKKKEGDEKKEEQGGGENKHQKNARDSVERVRNSARKMMEKMLLPPGYNHTPFSSDFLNRFHEIDKLYKDRAGRFALLGEEPDGESPQHQHFLAREEMPLGEFDSKMVDWSATRMLMQDDGEAHMEFYKRSMPIILPFEAAPSPVSIPDISFVVDSSSSMGFDPINGQGQYHAVALAFYSILRFLEEENLAQFVKYNVINFSAAQPTCSEWQDYSDISYVKKALLDYHGLGTYLDPLSLKKLYETRTDNFISFWLSDMSFNSPLNEIAVLKQVDNMLNSGGVGFFFFVLGMQTSFSKALEERGVPVTYIKSADEFLKGSVKISKQLYGELSK